MPLTSTASFDPDALKVLQTTYGEACQWPASRNGSAPDDETWEKFDFYGRHGVEEIGVADPHDGLLRWFDLAGERHEETDTSRLLGITTAELSSRIDWPG